MNLKDRLNRNWFDFRDMHLRHELAFLNSFTDIVGGFTEDYIREWLFRTQGVEFDPTVSSNNDVCFQYDKGGNLLGIEKKGGEHRVEFDGAFVFDGKFYVYDVKTNKLNGYTNSIERVLKYFEMAFPVNRGKLLVFQPICGDRDKIEHSKKLSSLYDEKIDFIDSRYNFMKLKRWLSSEVDEVKGI